MNLSESQPTQQTRAGCKRREESPEQASAPRKRQRQDVPPAHRDDDGSNEGNNSSGSSSIDYGANQYKQYTQYLASLVQDMRDSESTHCTATDIEITLGDFCNAIRSFSAHHNASQTSDKKLHVILTHLHEEHGAMDVILNVLSQPHHTVETYKWAMAALVWFIFTPGERSTRAVSTGALDSIVAIMRQHRSQPQQKSRPQPTEAAIPNREEKLYSAALSVLVQLLGNADSDVLRRTLQAHLQEEVDTRSTSTADETTPNTRPVTPDQATSDGRATPPSQQKPSPWFLLEDITMALEMFPSSVSIFKQGCALFGGLHILLMNAKPSTPATTTTTASPALHHVMLQKAPTDWHMLKGRTAQCIYRNGLLDHGMWDADAKMISTSMLRLLLGKVCARKIVAQADNEYCRGAAA